MKKQTFLICAIILILMGGCAPKARIKLLKPGEMTLEGVRKIAILDFNTIESGTKDGRYAVDKDIVHLAKKSLAHCFYKTPFYSLVDLSMEKCVDPVCKIKRKEVFDSVVYGKVWWEISDEYDNFKPDKVRLEKWKNVSYVCGHDKKGRPIYCQTRITQNTQEKFVKRNYRSVTATLMLSLSVLKFNKDATFHKITQIFEVSKEDGRLFDGKLEFKAPVIIGAEARSDKSASLGGKRKSSTQAKKTRDKGFAAAFQSFTGSLLGNKGVDKKDAPIELVRNVDTIPTPLEYKIDMTDSINERLQELIAPYYEEFEVPIPLMGDSKAAVLVQTGAYEALVKYIFERKLAQNYDGALYYFIDEQNLMEGARKVITMVHEEELRKKGKPITPIPEEKLQEEAISYLKDHKNDLYLAALGLEATGAYDFAYDVYSYAFDKLKIVDQKFADGIGRCALAIGKRDEYWNKEQVKEEADSNKT